MKKNELALYDPFIKEIKALIYRRQYEAMKQVNAELIQLYWEIGGEIDRQQREQGWGKSVVEVLAKELQKEFPGVQGFSARNLWLMRSFYIEYSQNVNLHPSGAEIHRVSLPALLAEIGWKKNIIFDFIEMGIEHSEAELEAGIINNIRSFLSEMGGDFSFIGNQYHLDVADDDYYIDLLLYHRRLRCLIAIELKIGEFKPEYAGKMQFYLTALDETMKLPDENPSIGIIICKSKNRTRVEYTLKTTNKPIGVATYSFYETLPENMRFLLPSPDEIAAIIHEFGSDDE
ncbi:hypothetical protein AGMMS49546_14150 [Spirochaetia bacterium]|nr:hypothetical protein AGMMS49546_14150 [Spirochaetia bacterium]